MIGQTISHYQILEKLGSGGMGVVYKARDTHLDRFIAIKVLPPQKVEDADRKRRFVHEAKAASALNHPNILHIYDIAQADGIQFIAMEYVPGKTLDQVIGRKGLRLNELLHYAMQITDALAKSHSAGIVHRDLKPSNIMITSDGLVKILDFGLAKLTEGIDSSFAETATLERDEQPHTGEGMIVGTLAYMSPEQAEGKPVDGRSDIFSFGSVLYEMVTGQRAFGGNSKLSTLSAVLREEPKLISAIVPGAPPDLEKIITRCLRKEPERRWQHAADLHVALAELRQEPEAGSGISGAIAVDRSRRITRWAWISALAVVVLLIGTLVSLWVLHRKTEATAPPPKIVPFTSYPGSESQPAFSPDGRQIAFVWAGEADNNPNIYVKLIDSGTPLRLTNSTAPDSSPTWSPDGSRIAFSRKSPDGGIFVVSALGGPERKLADTEAVGIDWSPDGNFLAVSEHHSPAEPFSLFLLSLDSGEERKLTSAPKISPFDDFFPAFSPDGRTLAFIRQSNVDVRDIYVLPVAGGEPRRLTFDARRIDGLAWTADGGSIVFSSWRAGIPGLWKMSVRSGTPESLMAGAGNIESVSISRQGHRLAYTQSNLNTNIWRIEGPAVRRRNNRPTKLIASTRGEADAQFSPESKKIAFNSDRTGSPEIWVCDSDGRNAVQLTFFGGPHTGAPQWSADGRHIAFDSRPGGNPDIYVIGSEGGAPRRLTTEPSIDIVPSWSKDGRFIYFASDRTGDFRIWKVPSEGGQAKQVTKEGGAFAQESKDGKFLYYAKSYDAPGLWRVPVEGGDEIPIFDAFPQESATAWAVADQEIYFIAPVRQNADTRSSIKYVIESFSLANRRTVPFAALEKDPDLEGPSLAISPDERWILYSQIDQSGSDIMLMENFR